MIRSGVALLHGIFLLALVPAGNCLAGEEPPLPAGLGSGDIPVSDEPGLPLGLGAGGAEHAGGQVTSGLPQEGRHGFELSGFLSARLGTRLQDDPYQDQASLRETRLQLRMDRPGRQADIKVVTDLLYDDLAQSQDVDLETGQGFLDLREANALLRVSDNLDLKAGRQILTWGTGDLVFINDLFPKDFPSFFLGREEDYLKAPSDAVKISYYAAAANLDLVYTPRFDANRHVDGSRLSFYNGSLGRRSGQDSRIVVDRPDAWFDDDEIALRLYTNRNGYEFAAYGYDGYWKNPVGMDPGTGQATFPPLRAYGASFLGPLKGGIVNIEAGYYDSRSDNEGDNPNVPNSELRFLAGYQRELARELNVGFQYYLEHMLDHGEYLAGLASGSPARDENRHVFTLRLTRLLMSQDLRLGLFAFYSPSDDDAYVRLNASYRIDDAWVVDAGMNGFFGRREQSFFGQFEDNSNIYAGIRYNYGT